MTIWAHYDRETKNGQSLENHLFQVEQEMEKGLETVSFPKFVLDNAEISQVGSIHDIGKISKWFQNYIINGINTKQKSHALVSSALYAAMVQAQGKEFPFLEVIAIACHHGTLNTEQPSDIAADFLEEQYKNCIQRAKNTIWEKQLISYEFKKKDFNKLWRKSKKRIEEEQSEYYFFALQFLFSKLISADKRDSANLLKYGNCKVCGDVDAYLAKKTKGSQAIINDDRQNIKNAVIRNIQMLDDNQLENQRIFTLTAPTGIGKTLTSISAALLLATRLEQKNGVRPHIITAVPFLNILEQTAADYKEIFGEVLVHSSAILSTGLKSKKNNELPLQKKMLLETSWSAPVVLTTFVQLFESILSGENSRLIKVNRLANAIVILDEVQSLDAERYPLYAVVLDMLAICYGTRFILMTATQPKLFDCASIYNYKVKSPKCMELLPEYKMYFEKLKRTKLVSLIEQITTLDDLCDYIEDEELYHKNILIVVNKIADSIELYQKLADRGYCVKYLSTNLTRKDRKKVIQKAKEQLSDKKALPFIMVSTQTIEAGVDLDFDIAFRDLAPLESIIQTAGRVNRSGDKGYYCPVYLFNTDSAEIIYSMMAIRATKEILNQEEILEHDYQHIVEQYYNGILNQEKVAFDRKIYHDGILKLNYEEINRFKMIKNSDNRYSVIFLQNKEAEDLIDELCQLICLKERSFEDGAKIQQILNQIENYTVDIYAEKLQKNCPISFGEYSKEICGRRIELNYLIVSKDDLEHYYNETGFIAEEKSVYMF